MALLPSRAVTTRHPPASDVFWPCATAAAYFVGLGLAAALVMTLPVGCGTDDGPADGGPDASDTLEEVSEVDDVEVVVPVGRLVINEVQCRGDEWVEVINVGDADLDLGGTRINDGSSAVGVRLPTRSLVPGERLVVRGDFGLSCDRDPAVLWQSSRELDRAPARVGDAEVSTWGRLPDGLGPFAATNPTPNKANVALVDLRSQVFDANQPMPTVDLYVDAAAEDLLISEQKVYAPALFSWTDEAGEGPVLNVDIRIKGSITLRPWTGKPSLKLHFARREGPGARDFRGIKKLTLHNLAYDPAVGREWLAYELMRDSGLAVPRVGWAVLRINGVSKGLYGVVESYDEVFLADHYDETTALYEADGDFGDNGELYGFFLDEGDSFEPVNRLAQQITAADRGPGQPSQALPQIDWDQLAKLFALEDLLQHSDGMKSGCHNWFLHADGNLNWTVFPWSVDLVLVPTFGPVGPIGTCSKLARLCDRDEACHARFLRYRDEAARLALNGDYRERLTALAARAAPFVRPTDEPWSTGEFWPDLRFDVVASAHEAIDLLETRARAIRCATAADRGEVDAEDPTCDGFVGDPPGKP